MEHSHEGEENDSITGCPLLCCEWCKFQIIPGVTKKYFVNRRDELGKRHFTRCCGECPVMIDEFVCKRCLYCSACRFTKSDVLSIIKTERCRSCQERVVKEKVNIILSLKDSIKVVAVTKRVLSFIY